MHKLSKTTWRLGVLTVLLGATALAWWYWRAPGQDPAPPVDLAGADPAAPPVDLAGVDPAVAQAIEAAWKQVQQTPSAATWGHLGMVLLTHGWQGEAARWFARAEASAPNEGRWAYYHGLALRQIDAAAAAQKYRRAAALNGPPAVHLRLAEQCLVLEQADEAEGLFRRLLEQQPNSPRAQLGLGRLALQRQEWAGAIDVLSRCRTDPHTRKAAAMLLAEAYQQLGRADEAAAQLGLTARLPDDADWPDEWVEEVARLSTGRAAGVERALQLLAGGRTAEAVTLLQQLVHDYPDAESAWLTLGKALLQRRDAVAAETALRRTVALQPGLAEGHFQLGMALLAQNRQRDATDCFRQAVEVKPDSAECQYLLGTCLQDQGDESGAIAAYREAIRYKPQFGEAHSRLGGLLLKRGAKPEAAERLRDAVRLNPTDDQARRDLERAQ